MRGRKSTLDIVQANEIDAALCETLCQTGDILLYGNPLTNQAVRWYLFVKALQGDATKDRRLPMIHVAFIVKDPPADVMEVHGMTKADGRTFIFEATSNSMDGARLVPLSKWVGYELDPAYPDGKVLFRMRKRDKPYTPPQELWDWMKLARKIPYTPMFDSNTWYNAYFVPGSYQAMMSVTVDFVMDAIKEKCGSGSLGHIIAGLVGLFANTVAFIGLTLNFIWGWTFGWVSQNILGKANRMAQGFLETHGDGEVPHMTCSKCCAKAMMKGGLLDNSIPTIGFLPKDFLPKNIGAEGNLFDDNLNGGHGYSETLVNVLVTPEKEAVTTDPDSAKRPSRRARRARPSFFQQPEAPRGGDPDGQSAPAPTFKKAVEKRISMFAMEAEALVNM